MNVTTFTNNTCNIQNDKNWIHDPIFQKKGINIYKGDIIMMLSM